MRRERLLLTCLVCCGAVLRQQEITCLQRGEGAEGVGVGAGITYTQQGRRTPGGGDEGTHNQAVVESWGGLDKGAGRKSLNGGAKEEMDSEERIFNNIT